jgi:hypothetical protein
MQFYKDTIKNMENRPVKIQRKIDQINNENNDGLIFIC